MVKKISKKTLITFLVLSSLNILVFSILSFLNWSLLTGFLLGLFVSVLGFLFNDYFFSKLLNKKRTFKVATIISFLKFIFWLMLLSLILIAIIFLNKELSNSSTNGIFNVFTFIYGCIIVPTTIIFQNFIDIFIKKENK